MENTTTKTKDVKIIFQTPAGLWPIGDTLLTDDEFEKLLKISDNNWIVILFPNKVRAYPTTDCLNLEGLKDETLRKIADEKELTSDDVDDIVKNINYEGN